MKTLTKVLAGAIAATALLAQPMAGAAAEDLVVAVDTAFVPFEFKEGDKYVGFDVDMWDEIAREIGVAYELQPMDFNGIIPALQTGNIDVAIAGITIKDERKEVIDFSDGYYDSGFLMMVRADENGIDGPEDLEGRTLAVKTGTSAADYAKEHFSMGELRQFPNVDNAYLELRTGRVDVAMHDTPNVLYYIATAGNGEVKAVGAQMNAHQYGIGFPKGSPLVPKVNEALANMKADGRYAAIYRKWFGSEPPQ